MDPIVEFRQVDKDYPLGKVVVKALRAIDLSFAKGEFSAIAGPSGSGKTTLLNLIGCVDVATRGEVRVGGQPTGKARSRIASNDCLVAGAFVVTAG